MQGEWGTAASPSDEIAGMLEELTQAILHFRNEQALGDR
jgi:hypothetical protein